MRMLILVAFLLLLCVSASVAGEEAAAKPPVELGLVPWQRDFDAAMKRAKAEQKPLLVLFQEVPG